MSLADELDELDPDFAPRHHPLNDDLGSSFGSSDHFDDDDDVDDDGEVDPYARSLDQLGDGFGMGGMGSSLAELDGGSEGDDTFGSSWGNPVVQGSSPEQPHRTPRRRTASEASRNSLAFELASASKPGQGGSRDLLRELGIEEEDEGKDDHGGRQEDYSEDDEDRFARRSAGYGAEGLGTPTPARRGSLQPPPSQSQHSPPTTPSMQRRLLSSHGSSASLANGYHQTTEADDEAKAAEAEVAHATVAAEMASSLATTSSFLATLRSHTTAPEQPTASALAGARAGSAVRATPAGRSPADAPLDRQPVVEGLAGGVIKTMYELVREREQQTRELADFERQVSRQDPAWQAALGQVDDFDEDDDSDHQRPKSSTSEPGSPTLEPSASPPQNGHASPALNPASSAVLSISDLRATTDSLLATLAALHESSQVSLAAGSESARKLRALRGQAQAVQDELVALVRSEERVAEYERAEGGGGGGGGRTKGWRGRLVREELEGAGRGLEEGWARARAVLVVG